MKSIENKYILVDLLPEEMRVVKGGILPLIPIAIGFGKGFLVGSGVAAGVHLVKKVVDKASS